MELHKLKGHELKALISNKEVKVEEVTMAYLKRIKEVDNKIGAFLYTAEEEAIARAKELDKKISSGENLKGIGGIPIAIKDNISVKGMQNTCGSKMLEGYKAPYDSHVIERLKEDNAVILGKANMDEFAMGSSNERSAYKITRNPWDITKVPGGSSGGSAAAVAACEAPLALGTETGGSVRQPASFCGVVGLKPTYGRISRYGVTAFASTLDQVGTIARDVEDCALLTQSIAGIDNKDSTTAEISVPDYKKCLIKNVKGKKIGIPKELMGDEIDNEVRKSIEEAIKVLEENGAEIKECSLPNVQYSLAAYYILSSAGASSNLGRFDGIRYGFRAKDFEDSIDLYYKSRSEGLGIEVKRRILLGTYVLSAGYYDVYYNKALKVRNLIKEDFKKAFEEYDALISPTSPTTAFGIGTKTKDLKEMYKSDICSIPASLAGIPAISLPCGMVEGMPVGLQIMSDYFREDILFNLAYSYEQSTSWHKIFPSIQRKEERWCTKQ